MKLYWSRPLVDIVIVILRCVDSGKRKKTDKGILKTDAPEIFVTPVDFFFNILSFFSVRDKQRAAVPGDTRELQVNDETFNGIFPPARDGAFFISIVFIKTDQVFCDYMHVYMYIDINLYTHTVLLLRILTVGCPSLVERARLNIIRFGYAHRS